jgi:hypothetical protein
MDRSVHDFFIPPDHIMGMYVHLYYLFLQTRLLSLIIGISRVIGIVGRGEVHITCGWPYTKFY